MTQIAKRFKPTVRKEMILIAALRVARLPGGWSGMTRASIAKESHCAEGLVSRYLGSMDSVRRQVMKAAIKYEYLDLIAQGIATGDKYALGVSPILQHKAISSLMKLEK
jgi:AcrR family transcriptional regulator